MGVRLVQGRFLRFGAPFLILVVGGSFGLKEFAKIRYDFRNHRNVTKAEADKMGIKMKDHSDVTLETEFEKVKKIDVDTWENVRGPRPWEEGNQLYEEALQREKAN
ncbi:cytochrome c oxidase assembly protein COX16 homolog, mitochondrial [Procambarus clarkii]|uniref:cytochrome c oxidase assembly protein COX16 homolog, mitochondrial n=1 Tax=Procambarus clarkii TaxID=6728 RepID=UPI001E678CA6|nr:cytochrome c oxidase assembly protein COX16 homolog, mitochondrial-like [Procambarus clarkii]XP_045617143.1 cytochrome c oxidase assembly protein COX16 homolog, mitochondrial-like [Procambarus clarkii]